MARIVMKFGGTSVANIERIHNAARIIKAQADQGDEVAVTVSAMAGITDQLVQQVQDTGQLFDLREYDVVLTSGEQVTAGLLAIALQDLGVAARSWLGWQLPIRTDMAHGGLSSSIRDMGKQGWLNTRTAMPPGFNTGWKAETVSSRSGTSIST